ncbi:hypothetical protein AB0E19_37780, partial [Streptomyces sp. NPDC047974]
MDLTCGPALARTPGAPRPNTVPMPRPTPPSEAGPGGDDARPTLPSPRPHGGTPGPHPGTDTTPTTTTAPGTGTSTAPGTGTAPGTATGTAPRTGTAPGTSTGSAPGTGTVPRTGTAPGTSTGTAPGTGTAPRTGPAARPGTRFPSSRRRARTEGAGDVDGTDTDTDTGTGTGTGTTDRAPGTDLAPRTDHAPGAPGTASPTLPRPAVTELRLSAYAGLRRAAYALGPVTLFAGPSGSGKSTVLGAYEALARLGAGEPLGEVFPRPADLVPDSARPDAQGRRGFRIGCTVDGPVGPVRIDLAVQAHPELRIVGERLTRHGRTLLTTALRDPGRTTVQAAWLTAGATPVTRAPLPDDLLGTALLPLRVAGATQGQREVLA